MRARSPHAIPEPTSALRTATLACVVASIVVGCGAANDTKRPVTPTSKPASLSCPAIASTDGRELAKLFGVDMTIASRISRTMALLEDLQRTAAALDKESREVCGALAADLDVDADRTPTNGGGGTSGSSSSGGTGHPCEVAANRLAATKRLLGSGGLAIDVSDVSCTVPKDAIARCAGRCLTGRTDVVSAVVCAKPDACGLDFQLPEASAQCATRCGTRALLDVTCTASVDVRSSDARLTATRIDALRRDLPRLVTLATSIGPRTVTMAKQVRALVDELAETVDGLTSGVKAPSPSGDTVTTAKKDAVDASVVVGAVLAGCLAPSLADTVRASATLEKSLEGAVRLHTAFASR